MPDSIQKEDLKNALVEALEPFAVAIKEDFDRVGGRFNKIETALIAIIEDLKEARKERQNLERRINETYNAVDGFVKVVDKLDQEFTLMKEDIKKIKEVIEKKLGVVLD